MIGCLIAFCIKSITKVSCNYAVQEKAFKTSLMNIHEIITAISSPQVTAYTNATFFNKLQEKSTVSNKHAQKPPNTSQIFYYMNIF